MTETLEKYGIKLPDVGEALIDAGIFTDHLALATRGLGLSGVIKTGPLDLAIDKIASILAEDLTQQSKQIQAGQSDKDIMQEEYQKLIHLRDGLQVGLEWYQAKMAHKKSSSEVRKQIDMGNGYLPATFFQLGHPLADPSERVMDPRQGRNPMFTMTVFMNPQA
jgi:nitroreductase